MSMIIEVRGMSCGHCASAITSAVSTLRGVAGVEVDVPGGTVRVDGTPDSAEVIAAIEDAGYDVATAA
jgi:copper chaperone